MMDQTSQPLLTQEDTFHSAALKIEHTMTSNKTPPTEGLTIKMRRALGFSKGYNLALFIALGGTLMAFTLSQFSYVDVEGSFCVSGDQVGECYYDFMKLALKIHLKTVMPASVLVCFQFIPAIRRRCPVLHGVNGYLVFILSVVSSVGGVMSSWHAFGGEVGTHLLAGVLFIAFVGSMIMGIYNIRMGQVQKHRNWMLRGWAYVSRVQFIQN